MHILVKRHPKWTILLSVVTLLLISSIGWIVYATYEQVKVQRLADSFKPDSSWHMRTGETAQGPLWGCQLSDTPCPGIERGWLVDQHYREASLREALMPIDKTLADSLKCEESDRSFGCRARRTAEGYNIIFDYFDTPPDRPAAFLTILPVSK